MKHEDVMRALECCSGYNVDCCRECPIQERCSNEPNLLERAALALLREKDAEIERLKKYLDYKCIYVYDGEVMDYCVQGPCPHYNRESEVRAKVITEFAERLKYTLCVNNEENTVFFDYSYTLETIDEVLSEILERSD